MVSLSITPINLESTLPSFQVFLYLRCADGDFLLPHDCHVLRGHYVIWREANQIRPQRLLTVLPCTSAEDGRARMGRTCPTDIKSGYEVVGHIVDIPSNKSCGYMLVAVVAWCWDIWGHPSGWIVRQTNSGKRWFLLETIFGRWRKAFCAVRPGEHRAEWKS